jgi:hypothetical protein
MARRTVAAACLTIAMSAPTAAQPVTRDRLLAKAAAYLVAFVERFSNVVAEEDYRQQRSRPPAVRHLHSEFLLTRFPGSPAWLAFRDVLDVDGRPVAGRSGRLTSLFVDPPADALRRADAIARESARYNLADIGTLNNPLLSLAFLQAAYQPRFRWTMAGRDRDLGPDVHVLRFEEFMRPTILRSAANGDLFSTGFAWIAESTGQVVKTELQLGRVASGTRITTLFRFDPDVGIAVPVEMRESYAVRTGEVSGVATYGRFRRFQVHTSDALDAGPRK